MSDVRLTATNPADSSVVAVACNEKGELKLEEPILVEGPQGEKGDKGDPGDPFSGNFAGNVSFGGGGTFADDITVNAITVGRGKGSLATNTAVGRDALANNTTGNYNTAVGRSALYSNTTGNSNTAVGHVALHYNTEGHYNTAVGLNALATNTTGDYNTAVGLNAGYQLIGNNNTFLGSYQGAADLSNTLSLSTGETERMRISADDAVDFNQKCGFTPDGGLWITDSRGHAYRTTFAANDFMQWEAYTPPTRSEPQLKAEELEALAAERLRDEKD